MCGACPPGASESILRQVRDNIHGVPSMKCGKQVLVVITTTPLITYDCPFRKEDVIFHFTCSQRHIMCLGCFSTYCKRMLSLDKFRIFENDGYSVGCPGKGSDCAYSPVPDPHYFQIVDDELTFVSHC